MDRTGNRFAPPLPFEQAGDSAFVDFVADMGFKRPLDFACGSNFPSLGSAEKGR
jgi:hypothetical protein